MDNNCNPIENNCEIYHFLLEEYDKLVEIKQFLKNNYSDLKMRKDQIKSGSLDSNDPILKKYEKLFFVINDLSHKNDWGYHLFEILSFKEELNELYQLIINKS